MSFGFRALCRFLAAPVAAIVFITSMPVHVAQAALVPTDRVIEDLAGTSQRAQVQAFLAREDVRRELQAMEVDPAEAEARVASMSDAEIGRLADVIKDDPAGRDGIGVIVGAVVLVFIILLITDILGLTKIFPFTRSVR
jgi:hypothetical protein